MTEKKIPVTEAQKLVDQTVIQAEEEKDSLVVTLSSKWKWIALAALILGFILGIIFRGFF